MAQTTHIQIRDGNTNCGNIIGSFNKTVYKSDEDVQIMRWLSPLEPNNRHQSVRTDRLQGVGGWLLETSEFREWRESEVGADKAILFCSGNPGAGKTYLSSLVIDSLYDQEGKADATISYLYCDYLSEQEQSVTNMMGTILRQLVGGGGIPNYLREKFLEAKNKFGGRGLLLPDLMGMLRIAIASLHQVFICIDALDEFLPKHLPDLLMSLGDLVREFPRVRIFLTGRPHVTEDIQNYFAEAVAIPISPNTDDIRNYMEMRLNKDTERIAMNDNLRADIMRIILEKISDIFLLVSLNMDGILGEVTISRRRKKLEEMTRGNGLSDAYTATLTRLKAQKGYKSTLGMKALMWVVYSERPLRAKELRHALGVEVGSAELDIENVPAVETLVASALGLVTVEASSSTIRLVHFTLKEHLTSDLNLFPSPHSTIAHVCLTYLNFGSVRDLSPIVYEAPRTAPLLEYASHYWGDHTRMVMTENTKTLALKLLDRFDEHISAHLMLSHYNRITQSPPFYYASGERTRFTGLHAAAFLGIVRIVGSVLEMKEWNAHATDCCGSTALTWAAGRGHEGVVKMLLGRSEVNPDQADTEYGRTPLSWAAENGIEGAVKMLLERLEVNPDQADTRYGRTPLSWAADNGHEGIVRMLLERAGVNPDQPGTFYGQTPLSLAAENGREGVVRMLLERSEVNPDQADTEYARTPLSLAAENGHEGVVRMLLERAGVNPDQPDTFFGQTPLSFAAENGRQGVVRMLLERSEVHPDQADTDYGRTPLSWAARGGHEGVVKMLLERVEVHPNRADTQSGRTPLSLAAKGGHDAVVKMLLSRNDVRTDTPDNQGQTPLMLAFSKGHHEVARILRDRDNINSDTPDLSGQPSLLPSTGPVGESVVEMQSRSDPRADITDLNDQQVLPSADPGVQDGISDINDPVSKLPDNDLPPTVPPTLSQSPPTPPLKPRYPTSQTDILPNTPPTPSTAVAWYFAIAFPVCLLGFLVYVVPSSLPDIFLSHK